MLGYPVLPSVGYSCSAYFVLGPPLRARQPLLHVWDFIRTTSSFDSSVLKLPRLYRQYVVLQSQQMRTSIRRNVYRRLIQCDKIPIGSKLSCKQLGATHPSTLKYDSHLYFSPLQARTRVHTVTKLDLNTARCAPLTTTS